jgi:hypothetical protein
MDAIIGLDLSVNCSGYCIMDMQGNVIEAGNIVPGQHNQKSFRYPYSTLIKTKSMVEQLVPILESAFQKYNIVKVIVEEISLHRSIITAKSLAFVHAFLFWELRQHLDVFMTMGPGEWRGKKGVDVYIRKLKGDKDYKQPMIDFINSRYNMSLTHDDNDIADAIGLCLAYLFINKILTK